MYQLLIVSYHGCLACELLQWQCVCVCYIAVLLSTQSILAGIVFHWLHRHSTHAESWHSQWLAWTVTQRSGSTYSVFIPDIEWTSSGEKIVSLLQKKWNHTQFLSKADRSDWQNSFLAVWKDIVLTFWNFPKMTLIWKNLPP